MADKNKTNSVSKSSKKLNCKSTSDEKAKNFRWNTEMEREHEMNDDFTDNSIIQPETSTPVSEKSSLKRPATNIVPRLIDNKRKHLEKAM
eukprot:gene8484-9389_t